MLRGLESAVHIVDGALDVSEEEGQAEFSWQHCEQVITQNRRRLLQIVSGAGVDGTGESGLKNPAEKADALPLQEYKQVFQISLGAACRRNNVQQVNASLDCTDDAEDAGGCPQNLES
jgi:hypothetical protein